jgi:TatA/E family protein of Tat protein translocase
VFGIGMSEMIIILAVALLVFGPDKLPEIAKSISRGLKDLRRASDDLKSSVNLALDDDEPRGRPRVKSTAGIPGPSTPATISGSELAHDLPTGLEASDAAPADREHDTLVPVAAAGAVSRHDDPDREEPPPTSPAPSPSNET